MNVKSLGFKLLSISTLVAAFASISGTAHASETCPKLDQITFQESGRIFVSDDGKWVTRPLSGLFVPVMPWTTMLNVKIGNPTEGAVKCGYQGFVTTPALDNSWYTFEMTLVDPKPAVPVINKNWMVTGNMATCYLMNDTDRCPFELITPTAEVNVNPFGPKQSR